jgi:hypothetical protein
MANYDEVTHSNVPIDWNSMDPMFRFDTHFPERISRMTLTTDMASSPGRSRHSRNRRNRNAARFKTQPITFDEIKEVDEESGVGDSDTKNKEGLKSQFAAFSRSMDGLVPSNRSDSKPQNPSSRVAPESTETATTTTTSTTAKSSKTEPLKDADQNSSPPSSGLIKDGATLGQLQHDCARARRKKRNMRQRRSIEEEPEIENMVAT